MKRLLKILLFITIGLSYNLYAVANYNGHNGGENVSNVNGATSNESMHYSNSYPQGGSGKGISRYFKFKTDTDGSITITEENNYHHNGYWNHKLTVGTNFEGSNIYNGGSSRNDTTTFHVTARTTYYVRVQEKNNKNQLNFDINFDFTQAENTDKYKESNYRPFTLYRQNNIVGDMQIIGNSVMLDDGKCTPLKTNNNNVNNMTYANEDPAIQGDSSYFNSTSSTLTLPANVTGSDILYARLYWQGRTGSRWNMSSADATVKVKAFGSTYQDVSAKDENFNWDGSGDYQAIADITSLIQKSVDDVNSTTGYSEPLWVANVNAETKANSYGAWAMVIVYKDPAGTLRDISVYDGYQNINASDNNSQSFNLSGFLTPTNGPVDSKFLLFGGEGDISYPDDVTLTKKDGSPISLSSPDDPNNVFKSSEDINGTNVTTRTPDCQNTIGVDIRTFYIGTNGTPSIIGNGQTSTNITLSTTQDQYFPGVFAFSTQLYQPDVCYNEAVTYNGQDINTTTPPLLGAKLRYNVEIRNMNYQPALGVSIQKTFPTSNGLSYVPGSLKLTPPNSTVFSPKTDTNDTDAAYFDQDTNTSIFSLGYGADGNSGGTINYGDVQYLSFDANITNTNVNTDNTYYVTYENKQLNLTFSDVPIRKCSDFNNQFTAASPIGIFNVVHDSFSGNTDPTTNSDPLNALYTQVVNQPFDVKVLALAPNKQTLQSYDGDVNVSIIPTPNYTGITAYDQTLCNDAGTGVAASKWHPVSFGGAKSKSLTITPPDTAMSDASFIVQYYDTNTRTKQYVCSRDVFAIRPYAFRVFGLNQYQRAGEDFNVTIMAVDKTNSDLTSGTVNSVQGVADYNASISDLNLTSSFYTPTSAQLSKMKADTGLTNVASCPNAGVFTIINPSVHFVNGEANVTLNFSETGILTLNVAEKPGNEFAYVDRSDTNDALRYIAPANKIYDESNIANQAMLEFVPYQFITSAIYTTTNGKNWLYMNDINQSAIPDMASLVRYTITAQNKQNATTKNYTSSCFPDTDNSAPTINGLKMNTTFDLFLDSNITSSDTAQLLFYTQDPVNNEAIWVLNPSVIITTGNNSFREWIGPKNFKDGIGKADVYFDINRSVTQPLNPISIKLQDANTSTSWMAGLGSPKYFIGADVNTSKSFLYGQTNTLPQKYSASSGTAHTYFEVYCDKDGNKTLLPNGVNSKPSPMLIDWYQNLNHNATTDGEVGTITEARNTVHVTGSVTTPNSSPATLTLTYTGGTFPYATTMQNAASPWLIYNPYNANATTNTFNVEFDKSGNNWVGVQETNTSTDSNAAGVTNTRILW